MSEALRVRPDGEFVERILRSGGGDLKKCFQCATCSVACGVAPEGRPFPRKEMAWAQWGLKDRLLADPDVWLCHRCNDCTDRCPRGARPGDVVAAIRQEAVEHYAVPPQMARWANKPAFLPLLLAIPAALLGLALLLRDPVGGLLGLEEHGGEGVVYAHLFPHWLLIGFFTLFSGLGALVAAVGVVRFWKAMKAADAREGRTVSPGSIVASAVRVVKDILAHDRFSKCGGSRPQRTAHLGVFYGFAALFVVTIWAVFVLYVLNPVFGMGLIYPFAWWNPMKVLANAGGLILIAGCAIMIRERLKGGASTAFDGIFLGVLLGVGVTGMGVEVFRWMNLQGAGYALYFVHLVLVFALLVYLPYSKFAHMVYRTAALIYADSTGRNGGGAGEGKVPEKAGTAA